MKYFKEILKRGLAGMGIGVFINQSIFTILALIDGFEGTIEVKIMAQQFLISAIAGFYFAAISIVFNIDNWSLLKQTVTHFILLSIVYFPVSFFAGWMPKPIASKIAFVVIYIISYVIMWIVFKAYWKKKAMEINKELELRNKQNR